MTWRSRSSWRSRRPRSRTYVASHQLWRSLLAYTGDPTIAEDVLARLPEGQRAAVVLTYYADLRASEVARVLGTTSAAVRVSLMRARRRLRTLLEHRDD